MEIFGMCLFMEPVMPLHCLKDFTWLNGVLTQEYSKVNQYRLPAYHRLDFSATFTHRTGEKEKVQNSWVFQHLQCLQPL